CSLGFVRVTRSVKVLRMTRPEEARARPDRTESEACPTRQKSDSPCELEQEASMHGEGSVRGPAYSTDRGGGSWHVVPGCRRAIRRGGRECDPLGARVAFDWCDPRQA